MKKRELINNIEIVIDEEWKFKNSHYLIEEILLSLSKNRLRNIEEIHFTTHYYDDVGEMLRVNIFYKACAIDYFGFFSWYDIEGYKFVDLFGRYCKC